MKLNVYLLSLLAALLGAIPASAQRVTGSWTQYGVSRPEYVTAFAETPSTIYYLSGNRLHAMDRQTRKAHLYGVGDVMDQAFIHQIKYNPEGGYLAASSLDGMMYAVFDDGTVRSLPQLHNVTTTLSRDVNDFDFHGKNLVVATGFGVGILDPATGAVLDYGVYEGANVSGDVSGGPASICVVDDKAYMVFNDKKYTVTEQIKTIPNGRIYSASLTSPIRQASALAPVKNQAGSVISFYACRLTPIKGKGMIADSWYNNGNNGAVLKVVTPEADGTATVTDAGFSTGTSWRSGDKTYSAMRAGKTDTGVAIYDFTSGSPVKVADLPSNYTAFRTTYPISAWPSTGITFTYKLRSPLSISPWGSELWVADMKGIAAYPASNVAGGLSIQPFAPSLDAPYTAVANAGVLRPSQDGKRLYVGLRSTDRDFPYNSARSYNPEVLLNDVLSAFYNARAADVDGGITYCSPGYFAQINEDGSVSDRTVYDAMQYDGTKPAVPVTPFTQFVWAAGANLIVGAQDIAENPKNPGEIWIPSTLEGLYRIMPDGTQQIFSVGKGNLKTMSFRGASLMGAAFDTDGNLWLASSNAHNSSGAYKPGAAANYSDDVPAISMLPASAVNGDYAAITQSSWVFPKDFPKGVYSKSQILAWGDAGIAVTRNNPAGTFVFLFPDRNRTHMAVYRHVPGTESTDGDAFSLVTKISDGKRTIDLLEVVHSIYADNEGRLWVTDGDQLFTTGDLSALPAGTDVTMPVVFRRLGGSSDPSVGSVITGNAVTSISQAKDGTMWFSTDGNGIIHTDRDATKVLEKFDSSNSPLPSSKVASVHEGPDGRIYVGTLEGIYAYDPSKTPAAATLDNVAVIPSAAAPGYTGHFTVTGLTDSTPVKITDSDGNLLYSTTPAGGTLVWDGLDTFGARIGSGTYFVLAGNSSDPVARFIVLD